jgi:hypothetical protein
MDTSSLARGEDVIRPVNYDKLIFVLTLACGTASIAVAQATTPADSATLTSLPAFADGVAAYIYGYPLGNDGYCRTSRHLYVIYR